MTGIVFDHVLINIHNFPVINIHENPLVMLSSIVNPPGNSLPLVTTSYRFHMYTCTYLYVTDFMKSVMAVDHEKLLGDFETSPVLNRYDIIRLYKNQ